MRTALLTAAADAVTALPASLRPGVLVGFDGFIDAIIDVVATRTGPTAYAPMPGIAAFGAKVTAAAGKSANFELVVKQTKIGGNGPIMANALSCLGGAVTCVGLLGADAIHPVFQPLQRRAEIISLGPAATTDALEFADGKLMLGKLQPLEALTYANLLARCGGADGLIQRLAPTRAIATVNWTMTLAMGDIWERLRTDILPRLPAPPGGGRRLLFVDLADPAKRTPEDQRAALAALSKLQDSIDVVLGLNEAECRQILAVLGKPWPTTANEWDAAAAGCAAIRDALGLDVVMCHLVRSAAVAWRSWPGQSAGSGSIGHDGFFEPRPLITTGAGDHFNAGFVFARLAGLAPAHAILVGGSTSGHYVRTGISPSRSDLVAFLRRAATA